MQDAAKASTGLRTITARLRNTTVDLEELGEDMTVESYGWTPEMVAMRDKMTEMANEHPVFDFYVGVSNDVTSILDSAETGIRGTLQAGTPWSETVNSCYDVIDALIDDANNGRS